MASLTQRESGRWQVRVRRADGRHVSRTFERKLDAEGWARKMESEIERGVWRDASEAERTTVEECLDRYIKEYVPRASDPKNEGWHVRVIGREKSLATLTMARVRGADVATVRDKWLKKDGLAPATVVRRLMVISRVFNIARTDWGMEALVNPVKSVSLPRVDNARDRRVSDDEIAAICAASRARELGAFVRLAVETAMRRGELVGLRWEHIDLMRQTAHLPKTKNGYPRTVPLSSRAVEVLRFLPRLIDGRVFCSCRGSVSQAFQRAVRTAGLKNLRFHDLRHEATSRLADVLQAHELAKVTGHRDMRMVLRYYHPRAEDLAKKLG